MLISRTSPKIRRAHRSFAAQALVYQCRSFSITPLSNGVELAYIRHEPPSRSQGAEHTGSPKDAPPLVFIHGLFGSKMNNRSMSKVLARELNRYVYALDLRNHGDSSHRPKHDYNSLAEDVELFLRHHKLDRSTLIGHSMGGKTVMAVALRRQVSIGGVISIDNAPIDAALQTDFGKYIEGMRQVEAADVETRSEADTILQQYEPALQVRQFLLTNLMRTPEGKQRFRIPIRTLAMALNDMADFPFRNPDQARYEGPALVIRGTKSHYVADDCLPVLGRFFPKFELVDVDCGHWVTSEKPDEFKRAVVDFFSKTEN